MKDKQRWDREIQAFALQFLEKAPSEMRALLCEAVPGVEEYLATKCLRYAPAVWHAEQRAVFLSQPQDFVSGEKYDFIFVGRLLEEAIDPCALAIAFREMLSVTGKAIFVVANAVSGAMWQMLLNGSLAYGAEGDILRGNTRHLFSIRDALRLLVNAHYEDVVLGQIAAPVPQELRRRLQSIGIPRETSSMLDIGCWLLAAGRYDADGVLLRTAFTEEIRKPLAVLLRRIENGIELPENAQALSALCKSAGIGCRYLQLFIQRAMVYPERTLRNLAAQWEGDTANGDGRKKNLFHHLRE